MALADLEGQWQNWTKYRALYDLLTGRTLKMALFSSVVPSTPDGTLGLGDLTEIVASGYVAGGEDVTGAAITQVDASDLGKFTADSVVWAALGAPSSPLTCAGIYIVDTVGGIVNPLIYIWRCDTQPNGQSYTFNPNASGYATVT